MSDYGLKPAADPALAALLALQPAATTVHKPINSVLSTTGTATIWTPESGKKFQIHGWDIQLLVTTTTSIGATGNLVGLYDASVGDSNLMVSIVTLRNATNPGEMYRSQRELRHGITSSTADQALVLGPSASLGASNAVRVSGVVWGTEV